MDWLLLCAQDNLEQLVQPEPEPEARVDAVAGYSEDDICEILEIIPEMSVDDLHEALEDIGKGMPKDTAEPALREALDTFYTGRLEALVEGIEVGSDGDQSAVEEGEPPLEALEAFNPDSPWIQYTDDDTGKPYFHNESTGKTVWEMPVEGISGREEDDDDEEEDGGSGDDAEDGDTEDDDGEETG